MLKKRGNSWEEKKDFPPIKESLGVQVKHQSARVTEWQHHGPDHDRNFNQSGGWAGADPSGPEPGCSEETSAGFRWRFRMNNTALLSWDSCSDHLRMELQRSCRWLQVNLKLAGVSFRLQTQLHPRVRVHLLQVPSSGWWLIKGKSHKKHLQLLCWFNKKTIFYFILNSN